MGDIVKTDATSKLNVLLTLNFKYTKTDLDYKIKESFECNISRYNVNALGDATLHVTFKTDVNKLKALIHIWLVLT